jgi:hypothetical protein
VDLNLTDGQAHRVTLYLLDWDNQGRQERVDVLDQSGNVLASQTAANFSSGEYLGFTLTGHVSLRLTTLGSHNAVLSGLFFGTASAAPTAPPGPSGLKASGGTGQVSLSWTASAGATSYSVYRGTSAGGESATPIATGLTAPSFTDTGLSSGTTYFYQVTAVNSAGQSPRSAEASASTAPPASSTTSASFVGADTATQGSWQGKYGTGGYDLVDVSVSLPSSVQVSLSGQADWVWAQSTTDVRALQNPSGGREAATWYSSSSFSVDVNLTDGQAHRVTLYLLDWDSRGRQERVDVLDQSGNVLASQTASNFSSGEYLNFTVSGHVMFRFTNLSGPNDVLSGLFFGPS